MRGHPRTARKRPHLLRASPHKPENRAHIWLAVNAGSVLEDDKNAGCALRRTHGLQWHATLSEADRWSTSWKKRCALRRRFSTPTPLFDEDGVHAPGSDRQARGCSASLQRAARLGGRGSFEAEEVEKERAVVLEGGDSGAAPASPVRQASPRAVSRFEVRRAPPDRQARDHQRASRDTLLSYYRDWYRPDSDGRRRRRYSRLRTSRRASRPSHLTQSTTSLARGRWRSAGARKGSGQHRDRPRNAGRQRRVAEQDPAPPRAEARATTDARSPSNSSTAWSTSDWTSSGANPMPHSYRRIRRWRAYALDVCSVNPRASR